MTETNALRSQNLNRRGFLKIFAAGSLAVGLGTSFSRRLLETAYQAQETRLLMGTVVNLTVAAADPAEGQAAVQATFAEMERLIGLLDHRRAESALGRLNAQGAASDVPLELLEVVQKGLEIGELTQGAFDITVKPALEASATGKPVTDFVRKLVDFRLVAVVGRQIRLGQAGMALTLDGLAKGRVVDGAVGVLRQMGFTNILVEAGGDLAAHGCRADGKPWEIGIQSPRHDRVPGTIAAIPVERQAVATSGDYMNSFSADFSRHHILDPRTLASPGELASATVLAPTAMEADALSTAMMVLGVRDGLALVERSPQVEALLVAKDLTVYRSSGFPA